ncbi:hypothetical protein [Cohnella kolymensis]|uniref:hypothetical protein n=1 Tax=Cohnella kolymensis TaxID=1590652 RepID=UPI000AB3745D|nr:hypothetical protein [Cohnella kolymensis]
MDQETQTGKINAENVQKQLDQLEQQNGTDEKYKKGSTNEVQPIANDEGITQ